MSRKNFKVETAKDGQTTITKIEKKESNVPTGKIKTAEEREKRRKAREEQYKAFRVNALKRRAKRYGLTEEETEEKVKKLLEQLDTPNSYRVLLMFNPKDAKMLYAALDKEGLVCLMKAPVNAKEDQDSFCFVEADQETLKTIREIAPPGTKIHPYVKKKEPVLATNESKKVKKPTNNTPEAKKAAKERRKANNLYRFTHRKKGAGKAAAKIAKRERLAKAKKDRKANVVHLNKTKRSTGLKKASTGLKQAA